MPDPIPIAIIGMGCLFPKSTGLKEYWQLLYHGKDAISEIPNTHWQPEEYFDSDPKRPDHVYCKRGGFLDPIVFDPAEFGILPTSLEATDTSQLLGLLAAKMALEDSGYGDDQDFDRDRTSVILGVTGTQELVIPLSSRLGHPKWRRALEESDIPAHKTEEIIQRISDSYVSWQENSFPGLLGNVVAGRICNRLDLRGTNCVVDAACASSLSAVHLAMLELMSGRSDMVVTGGVDTLNDIFMHMCFSKTLTLSATGDARPFSKDADGTVLGEGIGMLVLKRLADAERAGNRIYAVIKGLGSSSDGKSQSIYSPRSEGQARALRTAYKSAGISPATVQLIEAHGTGTRVGDKVEFEALNRVFDEFGANGNKCALGSVKSNIGHTKASAGSAGLIKAALGLYHKVLPATLKAETPDPNLNINNSHFYLNTATRPWCSTNDNPRRAGVSAFGFGGSNFHVVLEEYRPDKTEITWDGSTEIVAMSAEQPEDLIQRVKQIKHAVENGLSDQEFKFRAAESRRIFSSAQPHRLLMVCENMADKVDLLERALNVLDYGLEYNQLNLKNIYSGGPQNPGKMAFVFPGQGSQYLGMGRDIVCTFPRAMSILEKANKIFIGSTCLSDLIFPWDASDDQARKKHETSLQFTDNAQPSIGTISLAMLRALEEFDIVPAATCGHSFGELTALCAAGWIDEAALLQLSITRGQLMAAAGGSQNSPKGAMLAVQMPLDELEELIAGSKQNIILANRNSPNQGVLSGPTSAILEIEKICKTRKIRATRLPVSAAFHSEEVKNAAAPFLEELSKVSITPKSIDVFSNTTGEAYPTDPDAARKLLGRHLTQPVDFIKEIENLYRSGIRTFVEIGPKSILTGLISSILHDRPFEAAAMDASAGKANGVADLARLLCRLASLGYPVKLSEWESLISAPPKPRMNVLLSGTNFRNQKTGDRRQRTEDREQKIENRGQKTEDGNQKDDVREALTEGRNQKPVTIKYTNDLIHHNQLNALSDHNPNDTKPSSKLTIQIPKNNLYDSQQDIMSKKFSNTSDFITDALGVVQEGLKSMQRLQHQTAQAHEKFLLTQAEANRALQEMMRNTQRLAERTLGFEATEILAVPPPEKVLQPDPMLDLGKNIPDVMDQAPARRKALVDYTKSPETSPSPAPWKLPHATANGYSKDEQAHHRRSEFAEPPAEKPQDLGTDLETTMLQVVSQLTGYPVEMIGLDMDIEADLGIDSIKRVEILSALEEKMPDLPAVSPDIMGGLKTLGQIAAFMNGSHSEKSHVKRSEGPLEAGGPPTAARHLEPVENPQSDVISAMLEIVSQLTGYPLEMLGLDMDIEADLGIDSIKRVEILSALEEKMPDLPAVSPEVMGTLKTLRQICDYLVQRTHTGTAGSPATESLPKGLAGVGNTAPKGSLDSDGGELHPEALQIPRSVVTVVEAPPISESTVTISGHKKVYVTEDNTGLSEEITEELAKFDIKTVRVSLDILRYKKQLPAAAGLIIVQDPGSDRIHQDLKEAFNLSKFLAPDLIHSANDGGAVFATITRLDGAFGFRKMQTENPEQGGLGGLAKTAAIEWPNVCCHAIDIAPNWLDNRKIASTVVKEIMTPGPIEIGLDDRCRMTLSRESRPYPTGALNLDQRDVLVISGGARGITAAAARELAAHTGVTLVLLGRSPSPFAEPEWLTSTEGESAIKKAIFENEYHGRTATPVQIEKAYNHYMTNREIADNLTRLEATGANVHYYSADVRNLKTVQAITDEIRSKYGYITGIIHGAGVLEDRLIIDKTSDQFERVYDTKVMGLHNLLQATRSDPLKYLVLFSSVAARFGNKGQVDYAMANEALNKIAQAEAFRRADCRVVSINWGPWDGGMVTSALKREFERNGIHLIPPEYGARCMLHEMMAGNNNPVEIVIGAGLATATAPTRKQPKRPALVKPSPGIKKQHLAVVFEREVDLRRYPILKSHMIDGKPVLPLALMIEWFAHGALHENPGLFLHGLDDIRVMKGIRLEDDIKYVRLLAGKPQKIGEFFEVEVELRDAETASQDTIYSKGRAILCERLDDAPDYHASTTMVAKAYTRKMDEVYDKILFHGPQLHGIRRIVSCSSRGIVAHISPAPAPAQWIADPLRNNWIADPLVLDSAFQMATVWCFEEKGIVSLPSYGESYRQYCHKFPAGGVTVVLEIKEVTNRKMRGDFTFLGSDDVTVARLTGYEAVMDASLIKAFKPQYRASA
ncbi:MAG: SDR family NAD(P)-dependent oxidoreductase [Desulfobacterales bacterium]|nr:MAG: SDR family NAD(P)-dependent oxidoreductase [Desulfobacterales bacterium]